MRRQIGPRACATSCSARSSSSSVAAGCEADLYMAAYAVNTELQYCFCFSGSSLANAGYLCGHRLLPISET